MDTARLERDVRILKGYALATALLLAIGWLSPSATAQNQRQRFTEIDVDRINVLDSRGVVRARLGAALPDAVIDGTAKPRGDAAAGLMLYDARGQERGGYITFDKGDNVALTLDTRKGQTALFVAGPREGAALQLWEGGNRVDLRADTTGARITTIRAGQIAVQVPPISPAEVTAMCSELKKELSRLATPPPTSAVLNACSQRMPEADCRACLGMP